MDQEAINVDKKIDRSQETEVRKGPWTMEEDLILMNYIADHGEGIWNNLARSAGLKRTGKSCRLRWLNYLRPDVRRGNITPEEQLLIVQLHASWGNRWSKIARQLPGRTDNEIKNYWRTRTRKKLKTNELARDNSSQLITGEPSTCQTGHSFWESMEQPGFPCSLEAYFPSYSNDDGPNDNLWTVSDFWAM
ncbi:hypothetical protein HPP92_023083 [Vanilla planifolia]|uniref:Uncharacterized protein n=1 Tax=Vanilla planifolia TaxID=51239 RepID=A0A835UGC2_VANPL|nr:hypothetical protein HPP92_023083 [Vanilla planifolia]